MYSKISSSSFNSSSFKRSAYEKLSEECAKFDNDVKLFSDVRDTKLYADDARKYVKILFDKFKDVVYHNKSLLNFIGISPDNNNNNNDNNKVEDENIFRVKSESKFESKSESKSKKRKSSMIKFISYTFQRKPEIPDM